MHASITTFIYLQPPLTPFFTLHILLYSITSIFISSIQQTTHIINMQSNMTDIRDEHGRPIQLTDEFGQPVQLTDEHGVPIHITGVATTVGSTHERPHMTVGSELHHKTAHDQSTQTLTPGLETHGATPGAGTTETHGGTHLGQTPVDHAKHGATLGTVAGVGKAATGGGEPGSHTQMHDDKKKMERANSSSSNSSEDDGQGGRRKKGLMQKIKDKLPGHGDKDKAAAAHSPSTDTKIRVEQEHEKKGFMDKIKDKLPGHH